MKYGIMYYKATDNIGDDIQTYAAMKYLPHIDYYIDRESLSTFVPKEKEQVSMIMNGWYIHNKIAWPPSLYINPLLISMHFKSQEETDVGDNYLKGYGGEFLKENGPVGARDLDTLKRLEKNNIPAYFSGCMTLTLEKFENVEKTDKIILVDVDEKIIEKVRNVIPQEKTEIVTHFLKQEETLKKSFETRMEEVENLLKKYQSAHLVITSRLHVALPCVALGTPVILLHQEIFDKDRFGSFLNLVDNYTNTTFLEMNIEELLENPKPNSDEYKKIRDLINKKCKEFIQKKYQTKELPNLENYKEYAKKLNWYKGIYEKERQALENLAQLRAKEFKENQKEFKKLNTMIEELNKKLAPKEDKRPITISVKNVYKNFNVYLDKANTAKEKLLFWTRNRKEKREVLKGVNLEIKQGEVVALIRNKWKRKINTFKTYDKNFISQYW